MAVLQRLGYTCLSPAALALERDSSREVLLVDRLVAALRRFNRGIGEAQVHTALRELTGLGASPGAPDPRRIGQRAHALLTQGLRLDPLDARGRVKPGAGRRRRLLRYLDWNEPAANDFVVTWQLPVQGPRRELVFDLVVFINGIPLVVLACPATPPGPGPAWPREALSRLWRAQELEPSACEQGAPRLFATVQLLAALTEQTAVCGGVGMPPHRFAPWQTCWPRTAGQVASLLERTPTAQDRLLLGMLSPPSLLDLLRHFILFAEPPAAAVGEPLWCRGSEYLAVQHAFQVARSEPGSEPPGKGGILWHAGGQIESRQLLTMAFLLRKLRADPGADRPIVLVVGDEGSGQALTRVLQAAELSSARLFIITADKLQRFLAGSPAAPGAGSPHYPNDLRLLDSGSPIVMFAQVFAPRLRELPSQVRRVLPRACLLGFTTLPPGSHDASASAALGPVLAGCSFADAVAEGTAVPVYLEARDPELHREREEPPGSRHAHELRDADERRYRLAAADRVRLICHNLSTHFLRVIRPQGGYAQLIVPSMQEAQLYKEALDRSGGPVAVVVESDEGQDARAELIIRCRPSATDAPDSRLHAIYVDALLTGSELLRCVVAVSAPAADKLFGLVIDYADAAAEPTHFSDFSAAVIFDALRRPDAELPGLQLALREALRLVSGAQNLYSIEQCVAQLGRPESRAALDAALGRSTGPLELLYDDPRAQGLLPEFCWLAQVLLAAAARYRDDRIGPIACGPRLGRLLADSVARDGTKLLITRVDLLSPLLDDKLAVLENRAAQLSELTQALTHAIEQHFASRPRVLTALRAELNRLLAEHKAHPRDLESQWNALGSLRWTVVSQLGRDAVSSLSPVAQALYAALTASSAATAAEVMPTYGQAADPDSRELAIRLAARLEPLLTAGPDAAATSALRDALVQALLAAGYAPERAQRIGDQALRRLGLPPAQAT